MFRAEAQFRNKCKQEKDDAEELMRDALKKYNRLEGEKKDMKHELERKERLALQAIAARSNMKTSLDEANKNLQQALEDGKEMETQMLRARDEAEQYKLRYEEMFNSVSALNKRIEELEEHKKHLLEKVKDSSLEYIVKTQKLENIQGAEPKNRVTVEDYRPEDKKG